MTVEMGERSVDLSIFERIAARSMRDLIRGVDWVMDSDSIRYNEKSATLSMGGESVKSGDEYARGKLVTLMLVTNMLLPVGFMAVIEQFIHAAGGPETSVGGFLFGTMTVLAVFGIINAYGSLSLIDKTDVIDHTTEPAPEAIADLEAAYMADEIDEHELGEKAAEVWADE